MQDVGDQGLCNVEKKKGSNGGELASNDVIQGESTAMLMEIPEAVVNLVDGEESVELEKIPYGLTKDEPTLKLDSYHYLFSLRPPPTVAVEVDEVGSNAMTAGILNYGVTFASEEGLELVDKYLHQHACFSIPTSEFAYCMSKLTMTRPKHGANDEENSFKAYWAALVPKVEDYNSMLDKAIDVGSGQIIKGLFMCSDAYSSQVQKGGEFVRGRVKAKNKPSSDSDATN
eukprot:Gb_13907 [translate_table: standard]